MKKEKQREIAVRHHVVNLLQEGEILGQTANKRVLCLGRWKVVSASIERNTFPRSLTHGIGTDSWRKRTG